LVEWNFFPYCKDDIYSFGAEYSIGKELQINIFHPETLSDQEMFLINEDGQEQNLLKNDTSWLHLPSRWLFEDFEEELKEGRQRYLDQQKPKEEEEQAIIKAAKAKLTQEELEALTEALQNEQ
jgi:hypothetical protein